MNKKGFTLIELLAVIFIVGIIATLALLSVTKYSNRLKSLSQDKLEESLKTSARSYMNANPDLKNKVKSGDTVQISYKTLYENDYLPETLKDIKSSKKITNSQYSSYCVQVYYEDNYKYGYNVIKADDCETNILDVPESTTTVYENPAYVMTEANSLLATLSGREYRKLNAGKAYATYYYNSNGYTHALLVGETAESVAYTTSAGGPFTTTTTVTYGGKTYYVCATDYAMPGNLTSSSGFATKLDQTLSHADAALALLQKVFTRQ